MANKSKSSNGKYQTKSQGGYRDKRGTKRAPEKEVEAIKDSGVANKGGYDAIKSNDISWWNQSPMYPDAVRVPFNRIVGDPIVEREHQISNDPEAYSVSSETAYAMPGIMVAHFCPSIGSTGNGSNAPVNRAFTSLYGSIYSKTTGAMQFTQADLALFMTGLTSIANLIAIGKRMLGISQLYNGMNYYYPKTLLRACGFDPDEVIGQQDILRMKLNDAILSFNNLKVPDFMSVYKRQYALCHNVYADADDVTAQLYLFKPEGYYLYKDTESKLKWCSLDDGVDALFAAIESCLTAWRNSSDLGLISGSIQRAFSDAQLISLDYVTSADVVLPTMDRNIMWQLNNSIATVLDTTTLDITQDVVSNSLVFEPKWVRAGNSLPQVAVLSSDNFILNSYDGQIDDEFVMEATRLMPAYKIYPAMDDTKLMACNTEIVTYYTIWYHTLNHLGKVEAVHWDFWNGINVFDFHTNTVTALAVTMASKVKNGPRIYLYQVELGSNGGEIYNNCGFIGDVYKYTTIDSDSLKGLNEAALQSVYATIAV